MVVKEENKIEKEVVTGITSSENEAKITLKESPSEKLEPLWYEIITPKIK